MRVHQSFYIAVYNDDFPDSKYVINSQQQPSQICTMSPRVLGLGASIIIRFEGFIWFEGIISASLPLMCYCFSPSYNWASQESCITTCMADLFLKMSLMTGTSGRNILLLQDR